MTLYASTDIASVHDIECPSGGHLRKTNRDGSFADERLIVDCGHCEPKLALAHDSWSDDPNDEELLTRAERLALERETKEGLATTAELAKAISAAAAAQLRETKAAKGRARAGTAA